MDKQREAWWNKQKNKSFCTVPWVTFAVNHWFAGPGAVSAGSDSGIKGGISVSADTDGNVSAVASVMGTIA